MSITAEDEPKHEIVIVRRAHGDHDEGHHGGVWKIAFADFMTAMMCFFLVMWLINASNEQTQAAVASYFNPVKLIDRNSSKKGLEDLGDGPQAAGTIAAEAMLKNANEGQELEPEHRAFEQGGGQVRRRQQEPFRRASLRKPLRCPVRDRRADRRAAECQCERRWRRTDIGSLDRRFRRRSLSRSVRAGLLVAAGRQRRRNRRRCRAEQARHPPHVRKEPNPRGSRRDVAGGSATEKPLEALAKDQPRTEKSEKVDNADSDIQAEKPAEPSPETVKAADAIRKRAGRGIQGRHANSPTASRSSPTKRASRSRSPNSSTSACSRSARPLPRRELVLAMEKIGSTLAEQKGKLTISGHTDARPFRNADYDNWRLSSARAQSAYYMLVRGGLDEARITEVVGHADRELKDKADPFGAVQPPHRDPAGRRRMKPFAPSAGWRPECRCGRPCARPAGGGGRQLQPFQMVRSLELVQDRIAGGDHAALPMQRKLLEMIDARFAQGRYRGSTTNSTGTPFSSTR